MEADAELLRRYVKDRSEAAFAGLVRRHLDLVYSAALRRLGGNAHAAADVAQEVFVALARQASSLSRHSALPGWLYATTRNVAVDFIRKEQRHRRREREAQTMHELNVAPSGASTWEQVNVVLEEIMDELSEAERQMIVLRFFAHQPFAEIGIACKLSEDAVRMRVGRALEKLRMLLLRRGVTTTAAALGLVLTEQAAAGAPTALALTVARQALVAAARPGARAALTTRVAASLSAPLGMAAGLAVVLLLAGLVYTTIPGHRGDKVPSIGGGLVVRGVGASTPVQAARLTAVGGAKRGGGAAEEPNAARKFLAEGRMHLQAKHYDLAMAAFTTAIELDPKLFDAYFVRAGVYASGLPVGERDAAKAVADYTRALEINPRDLSARHNRALAYQQLHEFDQAIADYTIIIETDVDFSRNLGGREKQMALELEYRGNLYAERKENYPAAIADFDQALRLDPEADMLHYRRGLAYQALKRYDLAETDFIAEYRRQPDYPNLLAGWAWQLATAPDATYRDANNALKFAVKAIEKFGYRDAEHLDVLAAAYAENGRFDEAAATERKAISAIVSYQVKLQPAMQRRLSLYESGRPFRDQ